MLLGVTVSLPLQAAVPIEDQLQMLAERLPVGETANGLTTTSITSRGKSLRFTYQVLDAGPFSATMTRAKLAFRWCSTDVLLNLFKEGAVFENSFSRPSGEQLGVVIVDLRMCEAVAASQAMEAGRTLTPRQLESFLHNLALNTQPVQLAASLARVRASASGNTLRSFFHVSEGAGFSLEDRRLVLTEETCTNNTFVTAMKNGGVMEYVFTRPNGNPLGVVRLDHQACKTYPAAGVLTDVEDLANRLLAIANAAPEQRLDNATLFLGAKADGTTLRSLYQHEDGYPFSLEEKYNVHMIHGFKSQQLRTLLKSGALLEYHYSRPNGELLGIVTIDQKAWDAFSNAQ
jgi:hypothetical protein